MMANENLDEPCHVLKVENESGSGRWRMCIFFCAQEFSNAKQKQREIGVLGVETSIETATLSTNRICPGLSVLEVLLNVSSCVLGPLCGMESENGLSNLSSSSNWRHCYFD
jgi:hypothetical protein